MSTRIILASLALVLALSSSACKSRHAPKEPIGDAPASEMEANFRQRWIEKRVSELVATGVAEPSAQVQAAKEFEERFNFNPAQKSKKSDKKKKKS